VNNPNLIWILLTAGLWAAALGSLAWAWWVRCEHGRKRQEEEERLRAERAALEQQKAELLLQTQEARANLRREIEEEYRERRNELNQQDRRLSQKEELLERRASNLEKREKKLQNQEKELERRAQKVEKLHEQQIQELERISSLSAEQAKEILLRQVEEEVRHEAAQLIKQIEEETREEAHRRAQKILSLAIERCAVDHVAETTVAVVPLASDEVKGRIIGREGRNIRAFETATGVDLIIDDTPEAVVISSFDPIRREVARLALERLISDGRIHPGRIEDIVAKCKGTVEQMIREAGEQATFETGVSGLPAALVRLLGKLQFRTSYGQNVLRHSIEVAHLAGVMAAELDVNVAVAKRAGLLHDIGKAVDFEVDGPHALISVDLARHYKESEEVIHAIGAHHGDMEPETVEAILVMTADAISASRPGARRDTLESYIQRLERLEDIADSFDGVEKAYAIQAGREIRVMVQPDRVSDAQASQLARSIAKKIETEIAYPGQIKVTVIREKRAVEYAK
jgi:ribonuclease Y